MDNKVKRILTSLEIDSLHPEDIYRNEFGKVQELSSMWLSLVYGKQSFCILELGVKTCKPNVDQCGCINPIVIMLSKEILLQDHIRGQKVIHGNLIIKRD